MAASGRRALVFSGVGAKQEALDVFALLDFVPDTADASKYRLSSTIGCVAEGPPPRFSHCACAVPADVLKPAEGDARAGGISVLIFGGTTSTSMLDDCWVLSVR
mmetsp:Transcript_20338/g.51688  ORF Transcript_20338/g.51688 Transcript_20338/m.51688 type:complete len:104 (-) Transcript_20338:16-327(-)